MSHLCILIFPIYQRYATVALHRHQVSWWCN